MDVCTAVILLRPTIQTRVWLVAAAVILLGPTLPAFHQHRHRPHLQASTLDRPERAIISTWTTMIRTTIFIKDLGMPSGLYICYIEGLLHGFC